VERELRRLYHDDSHSACGGGGPKHRLAVADGQRQQRHRPGLENRLRQRHRLLLPESYTYSDSDAYAYAASYPNADTDTNTYSNSNTASNTYTYTYSYTYSYTHGDSNRNSDSYADADVHTWSHSVCRSSGIHKHAGQQYIPWPARHCRAHLPASDQRKSVDRHGWQGNHCHQLATPYVGNRSMAARRCDLH
jgi:hypothetical protein